VIGAADFNHAVVETWPNVMKLPRSLAIPRPEIGLVKTAIEQSDDRDFLPAETRSRA
jgi:hypothetical protein